MTKTLPYLLKSKVKESKREKFKKKLKRYSMSQRVSNTEEINGFSYEPVKVKPQEPAFHFRRQNQSGSKELDRVDPYLYELLDMISVKRRHNTASEIAFCDQYMRNIILPNGKKVNFNTLKSPTGEVLAYYYKCSNDPVLWSSHVDSVHSGAGRVPINYDPIINVAYVSDESCPLGADDAAGMWILFQMIRAGVGGTYIFHKGEEVGGIGSSGIAKHHKEFLAKFKFAIAFDRKANHSVITHQGFDRCCSDDFADSFIKLMAEQGLEMSKDDGGIFTDTANYTDHIGECTNISCGYMYEHTQKETLDIEFLVSLKNAVIAAFAGNVDRLVSKRKPGETESSYNKYYKSYGRNSYGSRPPWDYDDSRPVYVPPTRLTKVAKSSHLELDKVELLDLYFDTNSAEAKYGYRKNKNDDLLDNPDYLDYDLEVSEALSELSFMKRSEIVKFIDDADTDFMCSVLRKLMHEAGYV